MTNGKYQRRLARPASFGPKNSLKSGKERNIRERYRQMQWEFCVFRPFPRVPHFPLSNYNQIKDRVSVTRHHWRV
jgi:hypothetical protein